MGQIRATLLMLAATMLATSLAASGVAAASTGDGTPRGLAPEAVVDKVVTDALETIAEQHDRIQADRQTARAIFDERIRPFVDTQVMARFVMGPAARQASPEAIARLESALARRIGNLYAGALQRYTREATDFASEGEVRLRTVTEDDRRAVIAASVRGPHVDDMTLRIQLYHREDRWRVFDIETSGVSILLVFRDALQSAGRNGDVDAMIAALEDGAVDVEKAWQTETDQADAND
jgi:phospholipid transport system substrate-binding protein